MKAGKTGRDELEKVAKSGGNFVSFVLLSLGSWVLKIWLIWKCRGKVRIFFFRFAYPLVLCH